MDQSAADSKQAAVDGPVTVDWFPALTNLMNVNKNGTTDEMDWDAMVQEEVKDQMNDADKYDISVIEVLSH